jgi:hypothetical protein
VLLLFCRCWLAAAVVAGLQVMITYVPGLNWFFGMPDGMYGIQWVRVIIAMIIVYVVVEVEKALVDPVLMPIVRPILEFIEDHSPRFLKLPVDTVKHIAGKVKHRHHHHHDVDAAPAGARAD